MMILLTLVAMVVMDLKQEHLHQAVMVVMAAGQRLLVFLEHSVVAGAECPVLQMALVRQGRMA